MRDDALGEMPYRAQGALLHALAVFQGGVRHLETHTGCMVDTTSSGHRALRKGRVSLPGQLYLVTATTDQRRPWFLDIEMARTACRASTAPGTWGDARLLCWVFMPDHWHGLVELGPRDDLARVMNRFKSVVSKHLRARKPDVRIWARGYHDHALRRDDDIRSVAHYIIANPLRAGLVERAGDYLYWNCIWL